MNQSHLWLPPPQPLPGSRRSLCLDGDTSVWALALLRWGRKGPEAPVPSLLGRWVGIRNYSGPGETGRGGGQAEAS